MAGALLLSPRDGNGSIAKCRLRPTEFSAAARNQTIVESIASTTSVHIGLF
eukprot:COSAG02_NODE_55669_length_289_cov_0.815789_1_plen_50_part_01